MQYVTSVERIALEKGKEEGREEAVRLLLRLLTHRFDIVPTAIQERLQTLTIAQSEALMDTALASSSLGQFVEQLPPVTETPTATEE